MLWPFNHYPGTDNETFNWEWLLDTVKKWDEKLKEIFYGKGLKNIVDEVLSEHPEWTTTLNDGSITIPKLASDLYDRVVDNIIPKKPLYGTGNTSVGELKSNDDSTTAPVAAADIVLNEQVMRTRGLDNEYLTGIYTTVSATTANTVTVAQNYPNVIPGMYVYLYTGTPAYNNTFLWYGLITSISGNVITVANFKDATDTLATPAGVTEAVINQATKLYNNHSVMHLKKSSHGVWSKEAIGNQTEFHSDTEHANIIGYDATLRETEGTEVTMAYRARADAGTQWGYVYHVNGEAYRVLSHENTTIINGHDAIAVPYVTVKNSADTPDDGAQIILTNGTATDLSTYTADFKAASVFKLINNSGTATTISLSNASESFRLGGSPRTVTSFRMMPQEVLEICKPSITPANYYVTGTEEFTPGDSYTMPNGWYPLATNQASTNQMYFTLPKHVRTCTSVTISGMIAVRQDGNNIISPTDVTNTSVFNSVTASISEFDKNMLITINLATSTGLQANMASIAYMQGVTFTFN